MAQVAVSDMGFTFSAISSLGTVNDPQKEANIAFPATTQGGATIYYRKRARDSACPSPSYVYWTATSPTAPYPGSLPCGGPLVDEVIIDVFAQ